MLFFILACALPQISIIRQITASHSALTEAPIARAPVVEWRYKVENNILYKRLYNYSIQQWIGDWIRA